MFNWVQTEAFRFTSIVTAPMNAIAGQSTTITTLYDRISEPGGVAIDFVGERVYWTDAGLSRIHHSDFNGGNIRALILSRNIVYLPQHLHINDGTLYWGGNNAVPSMGAIFKFEINSRTFTGVTGQERREASAAILFKKSQVFRIMKFHQEILGCLMSRRRS